MVVSGRSKNKNQASHSQQGRVSDRTEETTGAKIFGSIYKFKHAPNSDVDMEDSAFSLK